MSSKNGGTSTAKPVAEANLMTCVERLRLFKEFSSAAHMCTPVLCAGGLVRCAPTTFFCTVSFVFVAGFVYSR